MVQRVIEHHFDGTCVDNGSLTSVELEGGGLGYEKAVASQLQTLCRSADSRMLDEDDFDEIRTMAMSGAAVLGPALNRRINELLPQLVDEAIDAEVEKRRGCRLIKNSKEMDGSRTAPDSTMTSAAPQLSPNHLRLTSPVVLETRRKVGNKVTNDCVPTLLASSKKDRAKRPAKKEQLDAKRYRCYAPGCSQTASCKSNVQRHLIKAHPEVYAQHGWECEKVVAVPRKMPNLTPQNAGGLLCKQTMYRPRSWLERKKG